MSYTLGIDIGTFETKGVLVDAAGVVIATARHRHEMIVPQPGWAEHRPLEDWWGDFVKVTKELIANAGCASEQIKAIACSAIGPCMLPVDANDAPLMNGVLYGVDTRAIAQVEALTARIGEDLILERCGNALTSQSVGPKILWLKEKRPDLYAKTAKILTSTSFLVQRLTGEYVIDHYTAANFSPIYDVGAQDWCFDLGPEIATPEMLPRLLWSSEIAGHVTAEAAEATGLAIGTPVTAGTIDAAAEALSVGVKSPGDMMMMYGSTIFIITLTQDRVRDGRLWYAPWLFPGQHASMAGLATSGTLTHWFRDQFARDLPRESAFTTLASEADKVPPGSEGLLSHGITYVSKGQTLVELGWASPHAMQAADVDQEVVVAICHWDAIQALAVKQKPTYQAVPKHPSLTRDLALVVDDTLSFGDIITKRLFST